MLRIWLILVMALAATACTGFDAGLILGERNSETHLSFEEGTTEASGSLLAFDPSQHWMDISISIEPLDQPDDIDVVIVTNSGTHFQVLGSFHLCHQVGDHRVCQRKLPVMPSEQIGSWRVEAMRESSAIPASVEVSVTWVPLDA